MDYFSALNQTNDIYSKTILEWREKPLDELYDAYREENAWWLAMLVNSTLDERIERVGKMTAYHVLIKIREMEGVDFDA